MSRLFVRALAGLLLGLAACKEETLPPPPPVPVTLAAVERQAVPFELLATGTVEPLQAVSVQPQVSGPIVRVAFREGQDVEKGRVLFQIDPRPFQATLSRAEAILERDKAQEANARQEAARYSELAGQEYVTAQQYDQSRTAAAAAAATLAASQAELAEARLNLQYATIRAPIAGRTGSLRVREGNLVRASEATPLVTINQIRPILVRFAVPAANLSLIQERRADKLVVRAEPVGGGRASEGTMSFVDNAVDTTTGTIMLKGTFPNVDGALWPGEFVNVRLRLYVDQDALTVPARAVVTGQEGSYVFVVQKDSTAATRPVKVVRQAGDLAVVERRDRARATGSDRRPAAAAAGLEGSGQGGHMSFTELFIRRPVMTTLVMAGILIFGLVAYRSLPVSDLPAVDYPTISVNASLPGASPETMASSVATPLEKEFSTIPGIEVMTSTSSQGGTSISLQFALSRNIDAAAQDVQAAISQAMRSLPQDIQPPSFRKVDPSSRSILYYALRSRTLPAAPAQRVRRDLPCPAALDRRGRGAGAGLRLHEVRRADPARSPAARGAEHRDRRGGAVGGERKRQSPHRHSLGHRQGLRGGEPGAARERGGLRRAGRGLPRRRPGASQGPGPGGGQRAGHQAGQLVQRGARGGARDPAAAGDQHGRGGRAGQGRGRESAGSDSRVGGHRHPERPLGEREGLGGGREVHPLPRALPRGDGDLPLSPERPGHRDPEPRAPDVHRGHVRGHVPARVQPGQHVADGADPGRRFRGGRRDRGAGEHRSPHRAGRARPGGGDQGEPGDHLHGDLDDHLAGRRVHPGALPRRAHRPAVRGVRGDHRRGDPGLGLRLAHPHPDAVQPVAQAAHRVGAARSDLSRDRARLDHLAPLVRAQSGLGHAPPADRDGVQRAHPGRHHRPLPGRAQGLHPQRGHRPALRHDGDGGGHQLRRHGAAPARRRGHRPGGSQHRRLHVGRRRRGPDQHGEPGPLHHAPQGPRRDGR